MDARCSARKLPVGSELNMFRIRILHFRPAWFGRASESAPAISPSRTFAFNPEHAQRSEREMRTPKIAIVAVLLAGSSALAQDRSQSRSIVASQSAIAASESVLASQA